MIHSLRNGITHFNLGNTGKIRKSPSTMIRIPVQGGYVYPITKSTTERVHLF